MSLKRSDSKDSRRDIPLKTNSEERDTKPDHPQTGGRIHTVRLLGAESKG